MRAQRARAPSPVAETPERLRPPPSLAVEVPPLIWSPEAADVLSIARAPAGGAKATTLRAGDGRRVGAPTTAAMPKTLRLPPGYDSLLKLSKALGKFDARFNPQTPRGRALLALALAIGGTEVYSRGVKRTDFFTLRGGTGNNMLGFAQLNQAFGKHRKLTPPTYTALIANILTGKAPTPNHKRQVDFAGALLEAVSSGAVANGRQLASWMRRVGLGGSNWQGIDDGWGRVPGLADALVRFVAS